MNIVLTEEDDAVSELSSEPDTSEEGGFSRYMAVSAGEEEGGTIEKPAFSDVAASMDIDTLPDLGTFSTTFTTVEDKEEKMTDSDGESGYNEKASFSSGNRLSPEGIAGTIAQQNSPEDMAKAVKTVLNREETS